MGVSVIPGVKDKALKITAALGVSLAATFGATSVVLNPKHKNDPALKPSIERLPASVRRNIVLIIADDWGRDISPCYPEGNLKPNTPNIQALCDQGVVFDNFWTSPLCAPTRASIITGKFGTRTGVLAMGTGEIALNTGESSVFRQLSSRGSSGETYRNAVIGKWGVAGINASQNSSHPKSMGVGFFDGFLGSSVDSYYRWQRLDNSGKQTISTSYTTSQFGGIASDWVSSARAHPWFLYLAFNSPHTPYEVPPPLTYTPRNLNSAFNKYLASIEVMDLAIGELLRTLRATNQLQNTVFILMGDNGSAGAVLQQPYNRSSSDLRGKETLYQGGINTPLIVAGAGVTRRGVRDSSMINATDLYATILDIAGMGVSTSYDSISFKGLLTGSGRSTTRNFNFSAIKKYVRSGGKQTGYAISDGRYKLIEWYDRRGQIDKTELFDLKSDPYEGFNLSGDRSKAYIIQRLQSVAKSPSYGFNPYR